MEVMAPRAAVPERSGGLGGGVAAILMELAARLERLAANGDTALIDLRSLPMSPTDRGELQEALGKGEVTATLDAQGVSTLSETAFAGIWWTVHRDRDGAVSSELLEVCLVPQILSANPEDIALAAAALRRRIGGATATATTATATTATATTAATAIAIATEPCATATDSP
jgi:hydrogenase-1 operon protein HyaF